MSSDGYGTSDAVPVRLIDISARRRRLVLLVPAVLVIASAFYITRWCLGNTLALQGHDIIIAQWAGRLSPSDPQTHFTLAVLHEKSLSPEELPQAVREYERAVSLSPNDFRLWQALGRARERAGDPAAGEQALKRAVELAPHYANPHWLLGNLLLRQQRVDEAFVELRRAGELLPTLRPQILVLAWIVFDGDVESIITAMGDTPSTRTELVELLLNRKRVDKALALWAGLGRKEKREHSKTGEVLLQALLTANRFRDAWNVSGEIANENTPPVSPGELANAGFEKDIRLSSQDHFGWQVGQGRQPAITIDTVRFHGGKRSLLLTLSSPSGTDVRTVSQLVIVEPGKQYRLEFYARTEDLKGLNTLVVDVVSVGQSANKLATSLPLPTGSNDWRLYDLEFTTPQSVEAIIIQLTSVPCPSSVCPILGKVWYDDFNLKRIG